MYNYDTGYGYNYDVESKSFLTKQSPCVIVRTDELSADGGPGSGNWGHAGVKGKVGGSAKGTGGKQHRLTTPSGGFTSRSQAEKENKQRSKGGGGSSGGSQGQTIQKGSTLKSSKDLDNARAEYKKENSDYNDKSFTSYKQGASNGDEIMEQCEVDEDRMISMSKSIRSYTVNSDNILLATRLGKEKYLKKKIFATEDDYYEAIERAAYIEEYILKSPKTSTTLYRGMTLGKRDFEKLIKKVENKEIISEGNLSSWSESKECANLFSRLKGKNPESKYSVVHVLKNGTAKGATVANLSASGTYQQETIISSTQKRRATGKIDVGESYGKTIYYIEEEEVYD